MRQIRRRTGLAAAVLLLLIMLLLAQHGAETAAVLRERIMLCLRLLIPSLYGCTAAALLLQQTGAAALLGRTCRHTARLLNLSEEGFAVFAVSQLAGYPVGALLLRKIRQRDPQAAATCTQLSGICFGCGPAFAVGFAGGGLFGNPAAGWMLYAANILANLLLALLTRHQRTVPAQGAQPAEIRFSAAMLPDTAAGAVRSMTQICGMVLLFGVVNVLCGVTGMTAAAARLGGLCGIPAQTVNALLAAVLDVTQLPAVCRCALPYRLLLALTGALLSFGGFCVHMQCMAAGEGICRPGRLLLMRFFAAILAFFLLYAAAPLLPVPETAAVFAPRTAISGTGSVLPALLIFCTGFPFLIKKD